MTTSAVLPGSPSLAEPQAFTGDGPARAPRGRRCAVTRRLRTLSSGKSSSDLCSDPRYQEVVPCRGSAPSGDHRHRGGRGRPRRGARPAVGESTPDLPTRAVGCADDIDMTSWSPLAHTRRRSSRAAASPGRGHRSAGGPPAPLVRHRRRLRRTADRRGRRAGEDTPCALPLPSAMVPPGTSSAAALVTAVLLAEVPAAPSTVRTLLSTRVPDAPRGVLPPQWSRPPWAGRRRANTPAYVRRPA